MHNNILIDIGGSWGGDGRLFQMLTGSKDVIIEHNTCRAAAMVIMADGTPHENFVFRYNIAAHGDYGVKGSGTGVGTPTLNRYLPGAAFEGNVLAGSPDYSKLYPPNNYFPATLEAVGFMDLAHGDYRLSSSSPYRRASPGGRDLGVDIAGLNLAMGSAGASNW
jgi:hypothetical protein